MPEYDLIQFTGMVLDQVRRQAYARAIVACVNADSVVLDLGAGPGLFTLLAAARGARVVYAVDLLDIVEAVPELAERNGFGNRVQVLRGDIRDLVLPERPDVVISDLRGVLPIHGDHLEVMAYVNEHVVRPGGVLIPRQDRLHVALVAMPTEHGEVGAAWKEPGLDLGPIRDLALATPHRVILHGPEVVSTTRVWDTIDYHQPKELRRRRWGSTGDVTATASGVAHGLACWFATSLVGDVGFTTAPSPDHQTYGHWLLPFVDPLPIGAGEVVEVRADVSLVGAEPIWRWSAQAAGGVRAATSLDSLPVSAGRLRGLAIETEASVPYVPELEMHLEMLQGAHDGRPIAEIAAPLRERWPNHFTSPEIAVGAVERFIDRYRTRTRQDADLVARAEA